MFPSEDDAREALASGGIRPGDVVVVNWEGPAGGRWVVFMRHTTTWSVTAEWGQGRGLADIGDVVGDPWHPDVKEVAGDVFDEGVGSSQPPQNSAVSGLVAKATIAGPPGIDEGAFHRGGEEACCRMREWPQSVERLTLRNSDRRGSRTA